MGEILNVFGVNWKLMAIQMVNFGLLLVLLHRFLYRPVLKILEQRRAMTVKAVEDAKKTEQQLRETGAQTQAMLTKATREAEGVVERAKQHADEQRYAVVGAAEERASRIVSEAEKRAEQERKQIVEKSSADIAKLAVLAAEKVLRI